MKKIIAGISVMVACMFILGGCTKNSNKNTTSYTLTASVNGTPFTANNCIAYMNSQMLTINFSPPIPYPSITIVIGNYTSTGPYSLDTGSVVTEIVYYPTSVTADGKLGVSGSVTITSFSTTSVSGTFHFVCADGTSITSGAFIGKTL